MSKPVKIHIYDCIKTSPFIVKGEFLKVRLGEGKRYLCYKIADQLVSISGPFELPQLKKSGKNVTAQLRLKFDLDFCKEHLKFKQTIEKPQKQSK